MCGEPLYDPPYDSPLEDRFAYNIVKYLNSSTTLQKQVEVETICGRFIIDFVADCGSKKVAFECDGEEYHDQSRDEWRDAMILGAGAVDVIYRLRGSDLTYHLEDCLLVVSKWEPEIFSQRGLVNLQTLATDEARYKLYRNDEIAVVEYPRTAKGIHKISILCRSCEIPPGRARVFWKGVFDYAREQGGGDLDELRRKWEADHLAYID